jgi:hypothetical protein
LRGPQRDQVHRRCGAPVEESRLAAIQENLTRRDDDIRAALHAEHARHVEAAIRETEEQARNREAVIVQRLREEFAQRLTGEQDRRQRSGRACETFMNCSMFTVL